MFLGSSIDQKFNEEEFLKNIYYFKINMSRKKMSIFANYVTKSKQFLVGKI
jgi:hypothetical protein